MTNATANLLQFTNALNVPDKEVINFKTFTRDEVVAILQILRNVDPLGHSAYLGTHSTAQQIDDAVVSVTYGKVTKSGRKYVGGPSYTVVIDHSKLNHSDDQYPKTSKREHLVIVKAYKRKDKTGYYLLGNIFDGKTVS